MVKTSPRRIFFDYAASTPLDERVFKAMVPYMVSTPGNPSALYKEGVSLSRDLEKARTDIARCISAHKDEVVFTSSGTESDNLAVFGVFAKALSLGIKRPHIITTAFEHPAVLEAISECEKKGARVTYILPDKYGRVDSSQVRKSLRKDTVLVSCMYVNNEIGTIQPIRDIAKEIRFFKKKKKSSLYPLFHVDATQAILYFKISVDELHVDLLTLDAQKMYGPKGAGLLFIRRGVSLSPRILGGGQESGLRSGTENVASVIGFKEAFRIAEETRLKETKRITIFRDFLIEEVLKQIPGAHLNGGRENRIANNLNICFPNQDGELLVLRLDARGIAVSSSSSCRTLAENSRSYVLDLLGNKECSESSLRITLGRWTTKRELKEFVKALVQIQKFLS